MTNRLINALQAEEPLDLNGFLDDSQYPPIDEPDDLVGQEITGWVVKKYPVSSPIVNMIADKHGNCFLLLRTFAYAGHVAVLQGEFELSSRLRFRCPERETNGARFVNYITGYRPFAFDRYARVVRGIGEDEDTIYVDQLGVYIHHPLLDQWSPPGTQFICSLHFHINWTLNGPKCEFFFSNFIQWTPEDLKFSGCKWPLVNDGGIETFRSLSMDAAPNFTTYENRPFNRVCARYMKQMPERPEDERLFEGRSFARITLWGNSPSRIKRLGLDPNRKLKYEIGKWYCVSVVSSRLDHRIWEIRSKMSIKAFGPIATEYMDQMDAFYRALEPDAYYVPTYRFANNPTPYTIEAIYKRKMKIDEDFKVQTGSEAANKNQLSLVLS
ncbi:hypothetical protein M3Y94_00609700 [Aphelenchoides besseyi]|nr:hypothetical protein M3Y94_00609700 [Aphelenchoides besseyi]KAI6216931.1 hypothetical protein M3Y95_01248700 [Aphelenchoides besseyi]